MKKDIEKDDELQAILDEIISKEIKKNPYFPYIAPFALLGKDNESIDELLFCEAYNIKSCLLGYYKELKQYDIDTLFAKANFTLKLFFELLNSLCKYISENTGKYIHLQNKITEFLQELDNYKGFGQVLQILILQGLLKWFENCKINENDVGFTEATELYKFVNDRFIEVCIFYFLYFDKNENSRPIDDFLATNEIYKHIACITEPKRENDNTVSNKPKHFNRSFNIAELKKLFDGLTGGGYLPKETNYSHFCYVFYGTAVPDNEKLFMPLVWQKTVGLLAYLIENLFSETDNEFWEITAKCFLWKGSAPNINTMKNTVSKYKNNNSNKPKGHKEIDDVIMKSI